MIKTENLNLNWSPAREVNTKFGPRLVRNAPANEGFWTAWRSNKDTLKTEGYSVGKDNRTGLWTVTHWGQLGTEVIQQRAASVDASRATEAPADITIPAPEGCAYLPYQRAGVAYALERHAALIGDEMGLGKTIQAIGIINCDPEAKRILIICPASLKINWKRELARWLTVKHQVGIVNGKFPSLDGIWIVNYDILKKHIEAIRATEWDLVILDEAHYIKNAKAQRTQLVTGSRKLGLPAIRAKRRVLLTGTPIANRPAELFSLIHYLDPVAWPNFFSYAKRYCGAFKGRFGWDFSGATNLAELQTKLRATLMVRRLKKDVLTELPAKRRQVIELPANGAAEAIEAEMAAYESRAERLAALQAAVELAKASDDPEDYRRAVYALKEGQTAVFAEISKLRHATAVAKIPAILDFVRDALESSDKVVLFLHHKDVVQAIAQEFGASVAVLVGDTPLEARQAAVDRFQTDPDCTLFVGSIGAAGVGITLTAASHVIFGELDWVPGNLSQAEDRCHRIGQSNSVLVQHIVLEGSLDATMAQRVVSKQEVLDAALDVDAKPVYADEPIFAAKTAPATADSTPKQIDKLAVTLTAEQRAAAHRAVQMIAGMCDGAVKLDDMGFNKADGYIGHSLAGQASLSPKQSAIAAKLARKYRRQLPIEINTVIATVFAKGE